MGFYSKSKGRKKKKKMEADASLGIEGGNRAINVPGRG